MHKYYPNIMSHAVYEIWAADPEHDYYFDDSFQDSAIMVTSRETKTFCEMIRCNSRTIGEDCTPQSMPHAFRSGNNTLSACEPACYMHSRDVTGEGPLRKTPRKEGTGVDSLLTFWHDDGKCVVETQGLHAYITDAQTRSDKKWTSRLNTLPTGMDFSFGRKEYSAGITDYGFTVNMNKWYCQEFYKELVDNRECENSLMWKLLGYTFIGDSLPRIARMACDNNWHVKPRDIGLEPDTTNIPSQLLDAEKWKQNIDETFTMVDPSVLLSDLGLGPFSARFQRRSMYWHSREGLMPIFRLDNYIFYSDFIKPHIRSKHDARVLQRKPLVSAQNIMTVSAPTVQKCDLFGCVDPADAATATATKRMFSRNVSAKSQRKIAADAFSGTMEVGKILLYIFAITNGDELDALGLFYGIFIEDSIIETLRMFSQKVIQRVLSGSLQKVMVETSERIMMALLKQVICRNMCVLVSKLVAQLALIMAEISSVVLSVIAVINLIGMMIDFAVLGGWDPGNFMNELTSDVFNGLVDGVAYAKRAKGNGKNTFTITPDYYAMYVMSNYIEDAERGDDESSSSSEEVIETRDVHAKRALARGEAVDRPPYYDLQEAHVIGLAAHYLSHRKTNSYGQEFNWETDTVSSEDFSTAGISASTIYEATLTDTDFNRYFAQYNIRHAIIAILLLALIIAMLFTSSGAGIGTVVQTLIISAIVYCKFGTDKTMTKILERIYRFVYKDANTIGQPISV